MFDMAVCEFSNVSQIKATACYFKTILVFVLCFALPHGLGNGLAGLRCSVLYPVWTANEQCLFWDPF